MSLSVCLAICAKVSYAQTTNAKSDSTLNKRVQSVYVELGGPGILLSINYDGRFGNNRTGFGYRSGLGFIPGSNGQIITIPAQLNYLLGGGGHYLEIGAGATLILINGNGSTDLFSKNSSTALFGTMVFGYRYQPVKGGLTIRAGYTPIFDSDQLYAFFGISVGRTF